MKNLISFFFLCAFFACKKQTDEPTKLTFPIWQAPSDFLFRAEADRNGKKWSGGAAAYYFRKNGVVDSTVVGLTFGTFDAAFPNYAREDFRISYIKKTKSTWPISPAWNAYSDNNPVAHYSVLFEGGDTAGFSGYLSQEGETQFIEILNIDEAKQEITGRFEAHFLFFASGAPYYDLPDKVSFTNGTFTAKIVQ